MFEIIELPDPDEIATLSDSGLVDTMALAASIESAVVACKSLAIGEYARRLAAAARPRSGPPRAAHPRRPVDRALKRRTVNRRRGKRRRRRQS
jgi:hypothetical protein